MRRATGGWEPPHRPSSDLSTVGQVGNHRIVGPMLVDQDPQPGHTVPQSGLHYLMPQFFFFALHFFFLLETITQSQRKAEGCLTRSQTTRSGISARSALFRMSDGCSSMALLRGASQDVRNPRSSAG